LNDVSQIVPQLTLVALATVHIHTSVSFTR